MIIKIFISSLICWLSVYFFTIAAVLSAEKLEWSKVEETEKEKAKKLVHRLKNVLTITLLPLVLLGLISLFVLIWG